GERAGAADGLGGAAAALAVVLGVGPELERDGDHVLAGAGGEQRGDGAVDAAAHCDERALARGGGRERGARAGAGAERAVQGVGGELGGVALGGVQAAELGGDLPGPHTSGVQQGGAAHERDGGAPDGDRGAAAGGVEAGVADRAAGAVGVERERDPDQVPAGGAAGGAGEGVGGG